jgi:hypothetical protein
MTKERLSPTLLLAYERLARINIEAANRSNDSLERGRLLDLARKFARKIGRNVERAKTC